MVALTRDHRFGELLCRLCATGRGETGIEGTADAVTGCSSCAPRGIATEAG